MDELIGEIRAFSEERDWGRFHTPKNLAMALVVEVAELAEPFQWLTPEESGRLDAATLGQVRHEIGDVLIYLVSLADRLGIDPLEAAREKLELNRAKYPADRVRGKALKYTEYERE